MSTPLATFLRLMAKAVISVLKGGQSTPVDYEAYYTYALQTAFARVATRLQDFDFEDFTTAFPATVSNHLPSHILAEFPEITIVIEDVLYGDDVNAWYLESLSLAEN